MFSSFARFITSAKETAVHDSQSLGKRWLCLKTVQRVLHTFSIEHMSTQAEWAGRMMQNLPSARHHG
jgi:hypothetical protein